MANEIERWQKVLNDETKTAEKRKQAAELLVYFQAPITAQERKEYNEPRLRVNDKDETLQEWVLSIREIQHVLFYMGLWGSTRPY